MDHNKSPKFFPKSAERPLERDYGIHSLDNESRRNPVTRGVELSHLVGKTFQVGTARFHGLRINEPWQCFENLVGRPEIEQALLHRSGLNAEVLTDGIVRVGDVVCADETS